MYQGSNKALGYFSQLLGVIAIVIPCYTHQPELHRWVCFAQIMMIMMAENPPFVADFPPWNPPFSHPFGVFPPGPCFHLSPGERMAGVGCLLQHLRTWQADQRTLLGEDHRLREQHMGMGSIPINTIFRGMNIHLPAIFDVHQGYKVLTHCHITTAWAKWRFSSLVVPIYRWMV